MLNKVDLFNDCFRQFIMLKNRICWQRVTQIPWIIYILYSRLIVLTIHNSILFSFWHIMDFCSAKQLFDILEKWLQCGHIYLLIILITQNVNSDSSITETQKFIWHLCEWAMSLTDNLLEHLLSLNTNNFAEWVLFFPFYRWDGIR